jgi:predicted phosphoribosyltransferase
MILPFKDRREAGRILATRLTRYRGLPGVLVLALPRGGVPVALEVAEHLDAPLDIFLVRKLGVPGHEELALGALASGGVRVLNSDVVEMCGLDKRTIDAIADRELKELERRERAYRPHRPPLPIEGKRVILIDDGLATGATMLAAARAVTRLRPAGVTVAVPVASEETCNFFRNEVDEIVCAEMPRPFQAVGLWYEDFSQTTDDEVRELLELAARARADFR